jgi:hypothetical protein
VLTSQHDVVLDYLNAQAYTSTARALATSRPWKRGVAPSSGSSGMDRAGNGVASGSTQRLEAADGDVLMGEGDEPAVAEDGRTGPLSERNLLAMERRRSESYSIAACRPKAD